MKKLLIVLLSLISAFCLVTAVACSTEPEKKNEEDEPKEVALPDKDFDGIPNELDPFPESNAFSFNVTREKEEDGKKKSMRTKADNFIFDLREFIPTDDPQISYDLAKFASLTLMYEEEMRGKTLDEERLVDFTSYVSDFGEAKYPLTDWTIYKQFGFTDVEKTVLKSEDYKLDPYDVARLSKSNQVFTDENGSKYQVILIAVDGYYDDTGWISNFDVGAETEGYKEFSSNGTATGSLEDLHPDWKDKLNHKGFDVTANRLLPEITSYYKDHKVQDATPVYFVIGHSRGGAIANLLGKYLTDAGNNTLAYCFESPLTTTVKDGNSYKNIFVINNDDSLVSKVPTKEWGFNWYGKVISAKVSLNSSTWNIYFNDMYYFLGDEDMKFCLDTLNYLVSDRDSIYEFESKQEILEYQTVMKFTKEDAESVRDSYLNTFPEGSLERKCIDVTITEEDGIYYVTYRAKPAIILCALEKFFKGEIKFNSDILSLLSSVSGYTTFLSGYVGDLMPFAMRFALNKDFAKSFERPHVLETTLVTIQLLESQN